MNYYAPRWTYVASFLLIINVAIYVIFNIISSLILGESFGIIPSFMIEYFALNNTSSPSFAPYQILSYAFLHKNVWHITGNMVIFWFFSSGVEKSVGGKNFIVICIASALGGSGIALFDSSYSSLAGFSAVSTGIAASCAIILGKIRVVAFIFPIPIWALVLILILIQDIIFGLMSNTSSKLSHIAHLSGGLLGILASLFISGAARKNLKSFTTALKGILKLDPYNKKSQEQRKNIQNSDEINRIKNKAALSGIHTLSPEERELISTFHKHENNST